MISLHMIRLHNIHTLRDELVPRRKGHIAFVPTMGNLHAGHLALAKEARKRAETVVVSIFVNPLQFGVNEDLDQYPRTLTDDQTALQKLGVDILFTPSVSDMYPRDMAGQTRIEVPELGNQYCGASRPGHFAGVTTIVGKLFNIVQPDIAVFGKKDYQQLFIIRRMVEDLAWPIDIIGVETMRETDGLAMSSRNQYLSTQERQTAPLIYQLLQTGAERLTKGESAQSLCADITHTLNQSGFVTDYVAVADTETLLPLNHATKQAVMMVAAHLGKTRLIDNLETDAIGNR